VSLPANARIGQYQILSKLGEGGMGEVYRARDTRLDRDVALKMLPASLATDPDRLMRFEREARTLAALNHPHIAQIYGLEQTGAVSALVMELVDGPTLAELITSASQPARAGIPLDDALPIARQIAEALEAAHEQHIVHRDLKPANVKVRPDGTVKVLDFGLAKALDANASGAPRGGETRFDSPTITSPAMTAAGIILGTAAYMSPEQARGRPVDRRADVWAFGVVLFEMLTGRAAFAGDTVTDVLAAVVTREPDWSVLPPDLPASVRLLLARCLDRDPRNRLRDIGEARIALAHVGSGIAAAGTPHVLAPVVRPAPRLPWVVAAMMAVIALATLAAVWFRSAATASAPATPMRFAFAPPDNLVADDPGFDDIVVSPDGSKLVFTAREGNGPRQLWVRSLDTLEARLLPDTEDAMEPFWSPDSLSVGFGAAGKLKRIDLAGRRAQVLADAARLNGGSSWSQAGVIVFAPDYGKGLYQVPADGGGAATGLKQSGTGPCFLPDGRHFIYNRAGSVRLASLDAEAETSLPGVTNRVFYAANPAGAAPLPDGATGWLLFVKSGDLVAHPFNGARLALVGEARRVATDAAISQSLSEPRRFLSVSDTGVMVLMASQARDYQLQWVDRAGKTLSAVGEVVKSTVPSTPAISPDGTKVVVQRRDPRTPVQEIWVSHIERGTLDRVTTGPPASQAPVWSSDGKRVFFQTTRNGAGGIYQAPPSGGDPQLLLEGTVFPSAASRDGSLLFYFQRGDTTRVDLWALPLDGASPGRPFPVLDSPFEETGADLSPDGRWLAYASDVSGSDGVYVRRFNGAARTVGEPVLVSTGGGSRPRWRRDGAELFYQRSPQGSGRAEMMVVGVKTRGETIEFGTPTPLFAIRVAPSAVFRDYDVTRDGQRFVVGAMLEGPNTTRTGSIVLLNWMAELK
jgi:Tol biopolymer transport system component